MKIEYDHQKRQATLEERGLDFDDAPTVFAASPRITWTDNRQEYGESRLITMGELAGHLVMSAPTGLAPLGLFP